MTFIFILGMNYYTGLYEILNSISSPLTLALDQISCAFTN